MTTETFKTFKSVIARPFNINETFSILKASKEIMWSWGFKSVGKVTNDDGEDCAFIFKVNGRKFKGYVCITLQWDDLYKVDFINNRGRIVQTETDIFFDCLVERIDNVVEK